MISYAYHRCVTGRRHLPNSPIEKNGETGRRRELVLARRACACASGDTVGSGGFFTSSEGFGVRN